MSSRWILGGRNSLALLASIACAIMASPISSKPVAADAAAELPPCTAKNSKTVSYRYVHKYSMDRELECVKLSGFIYGGAIHQARAVALSKNEPGEQSIGIWRDDQPEEQQKDFFPEAPQKAKIIGRLRDCGTSNVPHYCHYVGGPMISVHYLRFGK
jgi:hypothetical protein